MSALATAQCAPRARLVEAGGEPLLDEVLVGVWEGLTARQAVACPVCGGEMKRDGGPDRPAPAQQVPPRPFRQLPLGVHRLSIVGRCDACGATVA